MSKTREQLIEFALAVLQKWLDSSNGVAFTADFFGAVVFERGPEFVEPPDLRFLGAVFQRAKRAGMIKVLMVDGKPATLSTRSRHKSPLWVAA